MLNNLTNFFNLIANRKVKTIADGKDLLSLGIRDSRTPGIYQPAVIAIEDLIGQINLISITYNELQDLISTNSLIPGQDYLIAGVNPSLYDGNTNIIIKAATSNKLELQGSGIFYNPKYQESLVYTNRVTRTEVAPSPLSPFDNSFNVQNYGSPIYSLGLLSDGRIIAGAFNSIYRFNSDGALSTNTFLPGQVKTVAVQSDDKIIIGGTFTNVLGVTRNRFVRLNATGTNFTIDSSFSVGTGFNSTVNSVVLQPDGKVLVGGQFTTYKGIACKNIIRVSSSGANDATFTPSVTPSTVNAIALQSDGKILLGLDGAPGIMRLNANGTTDGTFIVMSTGFNGPVYSIALQSDGKIIAGGSFSNYDGAPCNNIARLNTDGTFDNTFNIGSGFNGIVLNIDIQTDDKILAAGAIFGYDTIGIAGVARLNSDGTFDDTFVNFNSHEFSGFGCTAILVQPDNKVLIGGNYTLSNDGNTKYNLTRAKELTLSFVGPVLQDSTSGAGLGWTGNLNIIGSKVTAIDTIDYGYGYQTGDTITILGSQIGGLDGDEDVILKVTEGITYEPGDKTIWGGYVWKNLTGDLGTPVDEYNLNSDWEKISYNTIDYNISVDTIEYQSADNYIWSRKDIWGNYVEGVIDAFQWSGSTQDNFVDGNSIFECINARNTSLVGNRLITSSIYNNIFDNAEFNYNELNNAQVIDNDLENGMIRYNHLNFGTIVGNTLLNSSIDNNILQADSSIHFNNMIESLISGNIMNSSVINFNILHESSYFTINIINTSFLQGIEMQNSSVNSNTLNNESLLTDLIMNYTSILSCNFKGSRLLFDNTFLTNNNGGLQACIFNYIGDVSLDLSTATVITELFTKTVFRNADGVPRLSYYDGSDTLIITDVNA